MRTFTAFFLLFGLAGLAFTAHSGTASVLQTATASAPNARAYNAGGNIIIQNGNNDNKLDVIGSKAAITRAYLVPSVDFVAKTWNVEGREKPNQYHDAAFLCVEVANISSYPLLVTAMKLEVSNPKNLRFGPGIFGGCPAEKVSAVTPECMLQPGQRKKWLLQKGFVIPGVVDFLKQESDEYIFDYDRPKRTSNDFVIQRFNQFLRSAVGDKTTLKVSIFELNYKPIVIGHFQLAKGDDLFATEPTIHKIGGKEALVFPLQHDSFLGEALSQIKDRKTILPGDACNSK